MGYPEQAMTTAETSPKRQYHKGNVAEDLMAVAVRILETERVEDLSVRRLAREVGVTPANFYNHFPSLNDLLLEIAAGAFDKRAEQIAHIRRTSKTRAEALKRSVLSYVDFACTNHQVFRIMFGYVQDADKHDRYRTAGDKSFGQLVELVYGKPIYDPDDLVASHEKAKVAYGVFAMSYGLARIVAEGQFSFTPGNERVESRAFVESVIDAFIAGELGAVLS